MSSDVSRDGKYLMYKVESEAAGEMFIIQSLINNYTRKFGNASKALFTQDSKHAVVLMGIDSLVIVTLGSSEIKYHPNVASFEMSNTENGQWLAYLRKDSSSELVLTDGNFSEIFKFANVLDYEFDASNNFLILRDSSGLSLFNLNSLDRKYIYTGKRIYDWTVDAKGQQIAFFVSSVNDEVEIYYYHYSMDSSRPLANGRSQGIFDSYKIGMYLLKFSPDGKNLFFNIEKSNQSNQEYSRIWSYTDKFINVDESEVLGIRCVSNIKNPKVLHLTDGSTTIMDMNNDSLLLAYSNVNLDEYNWNRDTFSLQLVSANTGNHTQIYQMPKCFVPGFPSFGTSPSGKYVVWFDEMDKKYYSYQVSSGIKREISSLIKHALYLKESDIPVRKNVYGVGGWLSNDTILIYDEYDIWKINLAGSPHPICLTKGVGRKEKVIFRAINSSLDRVITDHLLITAFNGENKQNGIVRVDCTNQFLYDKRCMGDFVYGNNKSDNGWATHVENDIPQRVGNSDFYIVKRMATSQSPNLFLTKDFITYKQLSNIKPELLYNWMKSQLVEWDLPNGKRAKGILYKPEDFDANRKYPIIFNYYEKRSDELNVYRKPFLTASEINIPWYVSNGYLVFIPDIHYETGNNADAISKSINAAVNKLAKLEGIDFNRMGAQGHSFGGYETLVLLTRTKLFKAAQESAGPCDDISGFSFLWAGTTKQNYFMFNQPNHGALLWEKPDVYLKNSPIFNVERVSAPLLIMHNVEDRQVPFSQAIEIFSALRRLQKPVWLLKYENEGHSIESTENKLDYNVKQQQFFDHYLRGALKPEWMK
ncbi:alpha/beta hydrolase family protein [Chitinophaga rhizophila]|uniref:Prolyl oligopeptidase family serine peptidase n=1 Tax=Chitinophaga rhizophila TaxID=2866212 RepID=A0ABS7GD21_9BACT|nr:prolyl oligopeptidase family serine peptidase [Chitinophaga rhizophila]MBW8685572.1 prolyl oligopeptidase family serine peptidase [Chitinophaga rhizophila]